MNNRRLLSLPLLALALLPACELSGGTGNADMQVNTGDLAPSSRFGLMRVTGTTTGSSAIATFVDTQQADAGCVRGAVGDCVLYHCAGTTFVQPNAGPLTITGGSSPVSLTVRNDGSYVPYGSSTAITFSASQKLTLDAPGAVVPLLHTDLTPPNFPFSLTNPDGSRPTIVFNLNRQHDYQITWTPLSSGTRIHAELNQDIDSNRGMILECDFDGTAGQGTMPSSLLSGFQLTDNNTLSHAGALIVGPSANFNLKPNGWDVAVYGMANSRDAFASITDN